jgi:hypothetical protein
MPDTCTPPAPPGPPVPVPYPNTGMVNQAKKTATKVKFVSKEVVTTNSEIPRTMGDEAGLAKGVMSNTNMDKVVFKKGSGKVKIQGRPCVYHSATTGQNGSSANMPTGAQVAPSQTKVLVAS